MGCDQINRTEIFFYQTHDLFARNSDHSWSKIWLWGIQSTCIILLMAKKTAFNSFNFVSLFSRKVRKEKWRESLFSSLSLYWEGRKRRNTPLFLYLFLSSSTLFFLFSTPSDFPPFPKRKKRRKRLLSFSLSCLCCLLLLCWNGTVSVHRLV